MNEHRGQLDTECGLSGKPKTNRLSRSLRHSPQTQTAAGVDPSNSRKSDFKTPTRIPSRSRVSSGFSGESPQNDSDFQQDIIWDATSPSPQHRLGKRGRKHRAEVVDISEIVSRIAPEYGRPRVAEPMLQQWIGDSAAIPCTPDVQLLKPKKKSPRPNGVDNLLKLAKQFDFNMFHQDEEEVDDKHQQSLELISEDILDFENHNLNTSFLPHGDGEPAMDAGTDMDHFMEDDLDLLFDRSTQHLSGGFSQTPRVKQTPAAAFGKTSASVHGSKPTSADFEDDWDNDDLLDDSLVIEMTQNPDHFATRKFCSTQKSSADIKNLRDNLAVSQITACTVENVRHRATFKLDSNPHFSLSETNSEDGFGVKPADRKTQKSRFIFVSAEKAAQRTQNLNTDAQKQQFSQKMSVSNHTSASKMTQNFTNKPVATTSICMSAAKTTQSFTSNPAVNLTASKTAQHSTNKLPLGTPTSILAMKMTQNCTKTPAANKPSAPSMRQNSTSNPTLNMSNSMSATQMAPNFTHKSAANISNMSATKTEQNFIGKPAVNMTKDMLGQRMTQNFTSAPAVNLTKMVQNSTNKPALNNTSAPNTAPILIKNPSATSSFSSNSRKTSHINAVVPPPLDFPDDDLDILFSSEPVWDDPADDDLLCDLCEDVENQILNGSTRQNLPVDPRPVLQPSSKTWNSQIHLIGNLSANQQQRFPLQQTSGSQMNTVNGSFSNVPGVHRGGGIQSAAAAPGNTRKDQFTFKKPNNPLCTGSNVVGKCSAAEIELKKQQAMERRRQRLQAANNLRAPT